MARQDTLDAIKEAVHEIEPKAEVLLYGSQARRDSAPESDWDILILVDGPVDENRVDAIRHRLYEVEWDTEEVISTIVRNRSEWNSHPHTSTPFYQNLARDAVVL